MRAARVFWALASMALLHGCGQAGTRAVAPPTGIASGGGASLIVALPSFLKNSSRKPAYLSPNARSVAVTVSPDAGSIYAPVSSCVTINAGTSSVAFAVGAPLGRVTVLVTANNGPCTAGGGVGTTATGAVLAQAGPVSGTIVAGQTNSLNGSAFFNSTPVSLGVAFDQSTASFAASLSNAAPNITAFEMDGPNAVMALPATLSLKDVFGNSLVSPDGSGNNVLLGTPITIKLTDTSLNAQGGTLRLAYVAANGSLLAGPTATIGNPPAASLTLSVAPPLGSKIVVLYSGATQSTFQSAMLVATYANTTLATIPIANQPVVSTLPFVYNVPAPVGIAVLPASTIAVGGGPQVIANGAGAALGAGSTAVPAANFTALALAAPGTPAKPVLYVADASCVNCTASSGGIFAFVAAGASLTASDINGITPTAVTFPNNPLLNSVGNGVAVGPIGLVALAPAQGGAAGFGSLLVAANNSIYRIDLTGSTASANSVRLIAGSGQAGAGGASYVDVATGTMARFNFGTAKFVGMATDPAGRTLYLADPSNFAVRAISLSGANAVTTIAQLPQAPVGLAIDGSSGVPYVTAANGNLYALTGGTATLFAGQGTTNRGSIDGFGTASYPVQFLAGNAASAPSGGTAGAAFSMLGLSVNTNANVGGNPPLATFATPMGIAWDPITSYFYVVDSGSQTVRRVL